LYYEHQPIIIVLSFLSLSAVALNKYVFEKNPKLNELKATIPPPLSPAHVFLTISGLVSLVIVYLSGPSALCNLIAVAYPTYASFSSLETVGQEADVKHWMVRAVLWS
jgi:hypothetical protein